jgi:hypothetical protein
MEDYKGWNSKRPSVETPQKVAQDRTGCEVTGDDGNRNSYLIPEIRNRPQDIQLVRASELRLFVKHVH